jgi:hypothetical protein
VFIGGGQADVNEPFKLTLLMALPPQTAPVSVSEGALDAIRVQYGSVAKVCARKRYTSNHYTVS